jgi:hypothetical protein
MKDRSKKLLWTAITGLLLVGVGAIFWVRRFHHYTPVEAIKDLRAAAAVGYSEKPVERFLELRYGNLTDPANRQKAFLDFFNMGHIEGLYILVERTDPSYRQTSINGMAQWVADYRRTMSPEEKAALKSYAQSAAGRATIREATSYYLGQDVRYRVATAGVISELLKTLAEVQKE